MFVIIFFSVGPSHHEIETSTYKTSFTVLNHMMDGTHEYMKVDTSCQCCWGPLLAKIDTFDMLQVFEHELGGAPGNPIIVDGI
jgi:hypothetical protein